jgi:hypothetical protein
VSVLFLFGSIPFPHAFLDSCNVPLLAFAVSRFPYLPTLRCVPGPLSFTFRLPPLFTHILPPLLDGADRRQSIRPSCLRSPNRGKQSFLYLILFCR